MQKLLIHALAVFPGEDGTCKIRSTIRSGDPQQGDAVWFETLDLTRKTLTVHEVQRSSRLSTITLKGDPDAITALTGGMYLRSEEA